MSLPDLEAHFLKCVASMHSGCSTPVEEAVPLQDFLEEAITIKSGVVKDLTGYVESLVNRAKDFKTMSTPVFDDSKGSTSDNELDELDLLKEDLMCIVCKGMDVGARNRLLECADCHALYHQECHKPTVTTEEDSFATWQCSNCKHREDSNKRIKLSSTTTTTPTPSTSQVATSSSRSSSKYPSKSSSSRHSSSGSTSYKSSKSIDKYKSGSPGSSSGSGSSKSSSLSKSSNNSSSSRTTMSPNINIISADKRIQIMKKKAAKQQEKKKQLPR